MSKIESGVSRVRRPQGLVEMVREFIGHNFYNIMNLIYIDLIIFVCLTFI